MLYFGDSVRSDTFPSKSAAGWDTVTILAEMEGEISEDETTTDEDNGQPAVKRARKDVRTMSSMRSNLFRFSEE